MKTYEQMTADVLRRAAAYNTARKRAVYAAASAFAVCAVTAGVIVLCYGRRPAAVQPPETDPTLSPAVQERVDALQAGDARGWLVYNGALYTQVTDVDDRLYERETYVGDAHEFLGFYQRNSEVTGQVYTVRDCPDLLLVPLSNGGTVVLKKEV